MIEVALFGAGRIGAIHAGNIARQPGVRLKYIVDVDAAASLDSRQMLASLPERQRRIVQEISLEGRRAAWL